MSRRHRAEKREIIPDPKFGDLVVTKFMNSLMYDGKKSVAESIVYGASRSSRQKLQAGPGAGLPRGARQRAPRRSRCARAASAAPPTRCRSKSAPSAARRWRSAG